MTSPAPPASTKKHDAGRIPGAYIIPNCVEIGVVWGLPNARGGHSFFHGGNAGSTVVNVGLANTLMASLVSAFNANLASFIATDASLSYLWVRDMSLTTNPSINTTLSGAAGTSASNAMPAQNAIVVSEKSTQRGRGANGRAYIPGWADNANAGGGVIAPALVTAFGTFCTAWFSGIGAAGLTPALAKPARNAYTGYSGAEHAERAASWVQVQEYYLRNNVFDTQRRRVEA
jgi:hypothetical protein